MLIVNGTVHCLIMNIGCLFGLRRLLALVELYHRFPTEKKKKRQKKIYLWSYGILQYFVLSFDMIMNCWFQMKKNKIK